ncbi:MAG: hypothetical protein ABI577_10210 [bacterium]
MTQVGGEPWRRTLGRWAVIVLVLDIAVGTVATGIALATGGISARSLSHGLWLAIAMVAGAWLLLLMRQAGFRQPDLLRDGALAYDEEIRQLTKPNRLEEMMELTLLAGVVCASAAVPALVLG